MGDRINFNGKTDKTTTFNIGEQHATHIYQGNNINVNSELNNVVQSVTTVGNQPQGYEDKIRQVMVEIATELGEKSDFPFLRFSRQFKLWPSRVVLGTDIKPEKMERRLMDVANYALEYLELEDSDDLKSAIRNGQKVMDMLAPYPELLVDMAEMLGDFYRYITGETVDLEADKR